jgi:hypothetical protein
MISVKTIAQDLYGTLADSVTHGAISGATVVLSSGNQKGTTDESGRFIFRKVSSSIDLISFSMVGYSKVSLPLKGFINGTHIYLNPSTSQLSDVIISSGTINPFKTISETDIKMRGLSNSQEALRIVPGLFIGQHQGGGKAEQIFLRGFDNDHGTDINMSVDGMPINMISHAHGQGYADSHFIIPETIESTNYQKGMYSAEKGDLAVTGFVNFNTVNSIGKNIIRAEAGQFDTYRILAMVNILGNKAVSPNQFWYAASEYRYSNSYFENPQHFRRFNFFTKYHGKLDENNWLTLSVSSLSSNWKASGQIPESALRQGAIGFYGALDANEGGATARTNVNAELKTVLSARSLLKNQLYYSHYTFDLHSNFSYYLVDTVNGDEIRQREARNLVGYNGRLVHDDFWGNTRLTTETGVNIRLDATKGTSLFHTADNFTVLDSLKYGDITELGAGAYFNEEFRFNQRFILSAGIRYDRFYYKYDNKLESDSSFNGKGVYTAANNTLSPKIKFSYRHNRDLQFYLLLGKGFHSNDARVVVAQHGRSTLPSAYGSDLGAIIKPLRNLLISAAVWYSYLQKEYVYAGDGGSVEFSGRTRRAGFDFSGRYQPITFLYLDADLNYAHGRAVDAQSGRNFIPLAPNWTSTGGVTYIAKNGLNGSLRYRWMGQRPANKDNSLLAEGYFVNDLVLNYTKRRYEAGLTVNNLFNVRWKETQFATVTRLKGEAPVDGITFTPGTKIFAVAHLSVFF